MQDSSRLSHSGKSSIVWSDRVFRKQTDGVEIGRDDLWAARSVPKTEACPCSRGVAGTLIQRVRFRMTVWFDNIHEAQWSLLGRLKEYPLDTARGQ